MDDQHTQQKFHDPRIAVIDDNIEATVVELRMLADNPALLWPGVRGALKGMISVGRRTVLEDFDSMCLADAFVGFSDAEWAAIRKFFAFNKSISGWDNE